MRGRIEEELVKKKKKPTVDRLVDDGLEDFDLLRNRRETGGDLSQWEVQQLLRKFKFSLRALKTLESLASRSDHGVYSEEDLDEEFGDDEPED